MLYFKTKRNVLTSPTIRMKATTAESIRFSQAIILTPEYLFACLQRNLFVQRLRLCESRFVDPFQPSLQLGLMYQGASSKEHVASSQ